jgi:hypothetical protein
VQSNDTLERRDPLRIIEPVRKAFFSVFYLGMLLVGWGAILSGSFAMDDDSVIHGIEARIFGAVVAIPSAYAFSLSIRAGALPRPSAKLACGFLFLTLGWSIHLDLNLLPIAKEIFGDICMLFGLWMFFDAGARIWLNHRQRP